MRRVVETAGVALVAVVLGAIVSVAASGSSAAWDSCPTQAPSAPGRGASRVSLIRLPARPVAAVACGYIDALARGAARSHHARAYRVRLSSAVAESLVSLLIDNRGSGAHSCDGGTGVVLRIRYARGIVRTVAAAGCEPEELWSGRRVEALRGLAADTVGGLFSLPLFANQRTVPEPAVVGKPLSKATTAGGPPWIVAVEEFLDPHARLGTIVWQSPLPGSPTDPALDSVGVLVSVPPARACRSSQLGGAYGDGGNGTGNHFGNVVLFDRSDTPCAVAGRLTLAGADRSGQVVTGPASEIIPSLVLSPGARVLPRRGSGLFAEAGFGGAGAGICDDIHRQVIVPSTWRVRVGAAFVRFPTFPTSPPTPRSAHSSAAPGGLASASAGL